MSVLLFPPKELRRPVLLAAWAATSVCETVRECTGLEAKIKWPNDVLIDGKKVSGILVECGIRSAGGDARPHCVVGIGLNVLQRPEDFDRAGLPDAGSLAGFTSVTLDRGCIAKRLIHQLDEQYDRLAHGDFVALEACWKWRVGLLGRQVVVECAAVTHRGRLRDLTFENIELDQPDGRIIRVSPEAIRHIDVAK